MSQLFVPVPGRLMAIKTDNPRAMLFDFGNVQSSGVVIRMSVDQSVAAQFQPSLDRTVYAIPFGDQVGTLTVGLLLNQQCDTSSNGVSKFIENYQSQRFSPGQTNAVDLIIGSKSFTGYPIAFQIDASSEMGHMIHGTLKFAAWMTL